MGMGKKNKRKDTKKDTEKQVDIDFETGQFNENYRGKAGEYYTDGNSVQTVDPRLAEEGNKGFKNLDAQDFEMSGVNFEELQKMAEEYEKFAEVMPSLYGGDALDGFDFDNLSDEDISQWFDELMNTPEVQAMMENPDLILDVMKDNKLLDDPLVQQALLENPDLLEGDNLKKMFSEGMDALKSVSSTLIDAIKEPEKLQEQLDQLMEAADPEAKDMYRKLLSGDEEALNEAMAKFDSVLKESKDELLKVLGSSEAIEEARQKLLSDPELAYLVQNGLLEDLIKDPERWLEAVQAQSDLLTEQSEGGDNQKDEL
jgi:predicted CopG family antitoxin